MDYRFFLVEGYQSWSLMGKGNIGTKKNRDCRRVGCTETAPGVVEAGSLDSRGHGAHPRHVVLGLREERKRAHRLRSAALKAGGARFGGTSSTQKTTTTAATALGNRWVVHLTEFNFILLVDTGYSAPLHQLLPNKVSMMPSRLASYFSPLDGGSTAPLLSSGTSDEKMLSSSSSSSSRSRVGRECGTMRGLSDRRRWIT